MHVQAREGKVALAADDIAAIDDLSESVKSKLALWVSAKDTEHIVKSGNDVATWYDVRETNMESPKYLYLQTTKMTNGYEDAKLPSPQLIEAKWIRKYATETNKQTMVYFRGYGSGAAMKFLKNGAVYKTRPMETSIVYGYLNTDNSFGYTFGDCGVSTAHRLWNESNGLPWNSGWASVQGDSKYWLDGEVYQRDRDQLPFGFHAFHARYNTRIAEVVNEDLNIFENGLFSLHDIKVNRGGEYLGEVMFFTNRLTHAERVEVQRYLDRKWFNRRPKTSVITLESGAELDVAEGDEENVEVTGNGIFKKTGSGTYIYKPQTFGAESPAVVDIEAGKFDAAREVAIKVSAGETIDAVSVSNDITQSGVQITKGTAINATTIEKTGRATAIINEIPAGTTRLNVNAGTLSLRPTKAAVGRYEVAIPNGDFSYWGGNDTPGTIYAEYGGWSRSGVGIFYNYDRWLTTPGTPTGSTTLMSAYGFDKCPPLEGRFVMMLKVRGAWTKVAGVVFSEPGEYELSYLITARNSNSRGMFVRNYLTDKDGNEIYIGTASATRDQNWDNAQRAFRFSVAEAGTYTLHFDTAKNLYGKPGTKNAEDVAVLINSLHLYRVGDRAVAWKIPNGDFEDVYTNGVDATVVSGEIYNLTAKTFVDGWTFDTRDDTASGRSGYSLSGVISCRTYCNGGRRNGSGYNESRTPFGGTKQALMHNNGATIKATFTPPKGTWYLKAQLSPWWDWKDNANISASIKAGETTTDLGAAMLKKRYVMTPYVWPNSFTADGSTVYELTLTMNGSTGANLDDFELVGAYEYEDELVKNGDFEEPFIFDSKAWLSGRTNWTDIASINNRVYGRDNWAFGYDYGSGDYFKEIDPCPTGGFYQVVSFPHKGWYRLRYLAKDRWDVKIPALNFAAMLVDTATSTTNVLDVGHALGLGAFCERSALFYVDSACSRQLLFRLYSGDHVAFDDISIRYVSENGEGTFSAPTTDKSPFVISIANNACLHLDFNGSITVSRLVLGGVRQAAGTYKALNCPQIVGAGEINVVPGSYGLTLYFK